jgi:raffinose/stachyose/melibiose transport system substrate-binding protein
MAWRAFITSTSSTPTASPPSPPPFRIYYNVPLLRAITGRSEPPRTYEELTALCEEVAAYAARTGRPLSAIVGSRYNAPLLMDQLFGTQVQRLAREANPLQSFPYFPEQFRIAWLEGHWDLRSPAIRSGFALMRDVSRHMPRGFTQLERDDAMFYFVQQRALMLMTGSWDVTSIRQQAPFELGVFRTPVPTADHPEFGTGIIGPFSEGELRTYGGFGLTRESPQPDRALDFLRFLTSEYANRKFSHLSGWLPVIVGVEPPEFMKGFMPDFSGVTNGPALTGSTDIRRLFLAQQHHLFNPNEPIDTFFEAFERGFEPALRADLARLTDNRIRTLTRNEVTIEALHRRAGQAPYSPEAADLTADLFDAQNDLEARILHVRLLLNVKIHCEQELPNREFPILRRGACRRIDPGNGARAAEYRARC